MVQHKLVTMTITLTTGMMIVRMRIVTIKTRKASKKGLLKDSRAIVVA